MERAEHEHDRTPYSVWRNNNDTSWSLSTVSHTKIIGARIPTVCSSGAGIQLWYDCVGRGMDTCFTTLSVVGEVLGLRYLRSLL